MLLKYEKPILTGKQSDTQILISKQRPIKLALVSCGLGNINRGVESSTARWFEALKDKEDLAVRLFAGGNYRRPLPCQIWPVTGF